MKNCNYFIVLLFGLLLSQCAEEEKQENYLTVEEIIESAVAYTPDDTELLNVEIVEFDEVVEDVTHGLIYRYEGTSPNGESLNTAMAIPLTYSDEQFSIYSTARLICKKIQECSGFCAIDRWALCECYGSSVGSCASINENHNLVKRNLIPGLLVQVVYP